ncbi:hypothetical protein H4Q31_14925 [Cohnella lubricantis]|uniref:Thioredoxin domain-containing protein n=1 Tax=Cohnella lubricantis TaxID=2163172 RepID=A0A841TC47_9BACL|nr:hypothetical protein [Cohnella lubricantis]
MLAVEPAGQTGEDVLAVEPAGQTGEDDIAEESAGQTAADVLAGERRPSVVIAQADADDSPGLASQFGIMSLPTVIVFKRGQPVDKLVGLRPKQVYRTIIDRWASQ